MEKQTFTQSEMNIITAILLDNMMEELNIPSPLTEQMVAENLSILFGAYSKQEMNEFLINTMNELIEKIKLEQSNEQAVQD
ncbi:hypothetical protein M5X02_31935 [Paenibacillus alvei]|uniref:hypothetical protein n=1 Tax=Paenibacillus alvei TaxID=44250 RepID=UPI000289E8B7|nr:hypothetical protein [Paenibacillus alvei]EJW13971.1 hypothetical protein PAV_141p00770 [Paenibacillus alvei DSM 29]MCY9545240.1 hypothetical protein [Paenibacillus alvei]MCY9707667.1 hypothetical protein [Paenibacillus alvei]MEC0082821.1 hypothetical protein [Paenibacillus alvei]